MVTCVKARFVAAGVAAFGKPKDVTRCLPRPVVYASEVERIIN